MVQKNKTMVTTAAAASLISVPFDRSISTRLTHFTGNLSSPAAEVLYRNRGEYASLGSSQCPRFHHKGNPPTSHISDCHL
ncbi:hypothetical protein Bca101_009135 [Brassica carinata]